MKNNKEIKDDAQSLQTVVSVSVTASELRLGIWVNDPIHNKCDIELNKNTLSAFILDWRDELKPIPLTEEWLLKFRFLQSMMLTNYWSEDEEFNVFIDKEGIHYAIPLDHDGNFWKIKKLDYVHQLQNLYSALTGSELQISSITEH